MTFNPPIFNAPTDPAFTEFMAGLKRLRNGHNGDRWNAIHKKWFNYPQKDWLFEDIEVAGTPPGNAFTKKFENSLTPVWVVQDFYIVDLFKSVEAAGAAYIKRFPNSSLVWVPWGNGDWRRAISRKVLQPEEPSYPSPRYPYDDYPLDTSPGDTADPYPDV